MNSPAPELQMFDALADASLEDAFAILGHHHDGSMYRITCLAPGADSVTLVDHCDNPISKMENVHRAGVYSTYVAQPLKTYRFLVQTGKETEYREDPYRFPSMLNDHDVWLFSEGRHEQAWRFLGAHETEILGVEGVHFSVWAPNARRVSVVGDFNHWDTRTHCLRFHPGSGIWEMFVPGPAAGTIYSFDVLTESGQHVRKADPYARQMLSYADSASVVSKSNFEWTDTSWLDLRARGDHLRSPVSIYEIHAGSWQRNPEGHWLNFDELSTPLLDYIDELGFTHLQLMPVMEHPFTGSWGYQPIGMFAPTFRFGSPDKLRALVNAAHQRGIGVLLDWVPAHFPMDSHGLGRFDGTALYEHADSRRGVHPDWNTFIYNYGRAEVIDFLVSNALYWIEEFHVDGLRMDAVASMLYLDYSREEGEWLPNAFGGRENLEAIELIKRINSVVREKHPGVMTIAEESSAWPGVTGDHDEGGLGFTFKWNMGWMNDTLAYLASEPVHRKYHHHQMTFSLIYAFSEKFVLPLSHDEVVHGKQSLLAKMPGDTWQKFANLRLLLAFMWAHPGKKHLFMGGEIGQWNEWNHEEQIPWHLLKETEHRGIQRLVHDLNHIYRARGALHHLDDIDEGFSWSDADNADNSIFAFVRHGLPPSEAVVVVANFTPVVRHNYLLSVPTAGSYVELINTDSEYYGGSNIGNAGRIQSRITKDGHIIPIVIPPLGALLLTRAAS